MTASRRVTLRCDRNGCERVYAHTGGDVLTARAAAQGDGWTTSRHDTRAAAMDWCPRHSPVP